MDKLVKQAMTGNQDAFIMLIENNTHNMYKIAWSYLQNDSDVADAMQEAILACYEKLDTLRHGKYFNTWLNRILINKCKDILHDRTYISEESIPEQEWFDNQYTDVEWKQLIQSLDEKYHEILMLYYLQELSVRQIVQVLDLNENTVLTRLRRGRSLLKHLLEE